MNPGHDEINKQIGAVIRDVRTRAGWTQEMMAAALNVTRTGYVHREAGATAFTIRDFLLACQILGMSANEATSEIVVPMPDNLPRLRSEAMERQNGVYHTERIRQSQIERLEKRIEDLKAGRVRVRKGK